MNNLHKFYFDSVPRFRVIFPIIVYVFFPGNDTDRATSNVHNFFIY